MLSSSMMVVDFHLTCKLLRFHAQCVAVRVVRWKQTEDRLQQNNSSVTEQRRLLKNSYAVILPWVTWIVLYCTISKLWLIVGQIFACGSRWPHFKSLARGDPLQISGRSLPLQKLGWFLLPDSENRMIVASFVWTKHRNVLPQLHILCINAVKRYHA